MLVTRMLSMENEMLQKMIIGYRDQMISMSVRWSGVRVDGISHLQQTFDNRSDSDGFLNIFRDTDQLTDTRYMTETAEPEGGTRAATATYRRRPPHSGQLLVASFDKSVYPCLPTFLKQHYRQAWI